MLVFIDESWDSGFKFTKWSSEFFTVWLVIFNDYDEALECDKAIENLRINLNKWNYEFHFADNSDKVKDLFLDTVLPYNFYYYWFVLNKKAIYWPWFKNKESFYKVITGYIFENAKDKLENAKIIIDKSWNNDFRKSLSKYLKRKMNEEWKKRIREVKMQESHKNNLLQLADYVASWINRNFSTNTKRKKKDFIKKINVREIYIQFWPKN